MEINNDIENPSLELVASMEKELDSLSPISSACCIYRVSERLRLANQNLYTPQVVSIGPLHHGKESLRAMEAIKKRYLQKFLQRTKLGLEHYINMIKANEARLRGSYAEQILFCSDEFVKMILVDAGFLAEVLIRSWFEEFNDEHHRSVFNKPWMLQDVFPDLLLLENQLPIFILEDLLLTVPSGDDERLSITRICHKFFYVLLDFSGEWDGLENIYSSNSKILHLVDFQRKMQIPTGKGLRAGGKLKTLSIPSISEVYQSGVTIKIGSITSLFDIRFSQGVLEIPRIILGSVAEISTRNIIAFEQCHCRETYVNDYIVLMSRLVCTPRDVDLLVKFGIVENRIGNTNLVSRFSNKIVDGVIINPNDFYFSELCEDLSVYCKTPWNTWRANLKQNYFNTPWATVSVIAASLLIILTIIQATCSVLSVTMKD